MNTRPRKNPDPAELGIGRIIEVPDGWALNGFYRNQIVNVYEDDLPESDNHDDHVMINTHNDPSKYYIPKKYIEMLTINRTE